MKLNQQPTNNNSILSYKSNSLILSNKSIKIPCFICSNSIQSFKNNDLTLNIKLIEDKIDLLIIGSKVQYAIKEQVEIKKIINCEFMNITSAIYTFNLLISDNRSVGILII